MYNDIAKSIRLDRKNPVYHTLKQFFVNDYHPYTKAALDKLQFGEVNDLSTHGFVVLTSDLDVEEGRSANWLPWLSITMAKDPSPSVRYPLMLNDVVGLIGIEPIKHLTFIRPFIDSLNEFGRAGYGVDSQLSMLDLTKNDVLLIALAAPNKPRIWIRFDYHALLKVEERFLRIQKEISEDNLLTLPIKF